MYTSWPAARVDLSISVSKLPVACVWEDWTKRPSTKGSKKQRDDPPTRAAWADHCTSPTSSLYWQGPDQQHFPKHRMWGSASLKASGQIWTDNKTQTTADAFSTQVFVCNRHDFHKGKKFSRETISLLTQTFFKSKQTKFLPNSDKFWLRKSATAKEAQVSRGTQCLWPGYLLQKLCWK